MASRCTKEPTKVASDSAMEHERIRVPLGAVASDIPQPKNTICSRSTFMTALLMAVFLLECFLLPQMELLGVHGGAKWSAENKRIFSLNSLRSFANENDAVWESALLLTRHKKSQELRIMVVGDSLVWGDGYANVNDIWWRLLERELHRRGFKNVQVSAVGLCGYNLEDQTKATKKAIENYRPDLVIWGYMNNDAENHIPVDSRLSNLNQSISEAASKILPQIFTLLSNKEAVALFCDEITKLVQSNGAISHENQSLAFKRNIVSAADMVTTCDVPTVFVSLTVVPTQGDAEKFEEAINFFRLLGQDFLDLREPFLTWYHAKQVVLINRGYFSKAREILKINPGNHHPSAAVGTLYAKKVADHISNKFPTLFETKGRLKSTQRDQKVLVNDCMPPPAVTNFHRTPTGYALNVPSDGEQLFMPLRQPFVHIGFASARSLRSIEICSEDLLDANLYITTEDPTYHCDLGEFHFLGEPIRQRTARGTRLIWNIDSTKTVNTIKIASAKFKQESKRELELRITASDGDIHVDR